jgi:hypothetical protein
MALMWRDAHILVVEHRAPKATTLGKIQHVHFEQHASSSTGGRRNI